MKAAACRGFTLVEMLLAMAITAAVAVSAMAALDQLVDADARATQNIEESVGVYRALQTLRRDVVDATKLTVTGTRCQAVQQDGAVVLYHVLGAGSELHRSVVASEGDVPAEPVDVYTPIQYSPRGHMRDGDYRADAVIQGAKSITFVPLLGTRTGGQVGLKLTITHVSAHGKQNADSIAMSLPLLETEAKP